MFGEANFFKPSVNSAEKKTDAEAEKSSKIKKIMMASVATLLLAMGGDFEAAEAQGKGSAEGRGHEKLADLVKDNVRLENEIIAHIKERGRKVRLNETEALEWKSTEGDCVTVGYDKEGNPKWISEEFEVRGGLMRITDFSLRGKDKGRAGRVVLNKNKERIKGERSMENAMKNFSNRNYLEKEAEISASVKNSMGKKDDSQVLDISREAGQRVATTVDFATGKTRITEDEKEIEKKDEFIQRAFHENLEIVSAEMGK